MAEFLVRHEMIFGLALVGMGAIAWIIARSLIRESRER